MLASGIRTKLVVLVKGIRTYFTAATLRGNAVKEECSG